MPDQELDEPEPEPLVLVSVVELPEQEPRHQQPVSDEELAEQEPVVEATLAVGGRFSVVRVYPQVALST